MNNKQWITFRVLILKYFTNAVQNNNRLKDIMKFWLFFCIFLKVTLQQKSANDTRIIVFCVEVYKQMFVATLNNSVCYIIYAYHFNMYRLIILWSGSFRDLGHLVMGPLVMGRFVIWVLSWLGHFVMGHCVMGHFVMDRFVMGRFVCESKKTCKFWHKFLFLLLGLGSGFRFRILKAHCIWIQSLCTTLNWNSAALISIIDQFSHVPVVGDASHFCQ
jgi:hypothetical protein